MSTHQTVTEAHAEGRLDVGEDNRIYWEEGGNPEGKAAVVLHGGPGSGCTPAMRRFFDYEVYRIVLFDQRGCGRSTPHASDPTVDLSANTTEHLLADIEALRHHRGIDNWLVLGVSWGCTLGLAYAERHPDRVTGMVLVGASTGRRAEIDRLYRGGLARTFPEAWERFRSGVPEVERDGDLVAAYRRLLEDPDPAVRAKGARDWTDWDWATASVDPNAERPRRWDEPAFQLARARICAHYFHHDMFLEDGVLLRNTTSLAKIPGVLINGRHDVQTPLAGAELLGDAWPRARIVAVDSAGHSTADQGMHDAIVAATDLIARAS